MTVQRHHFLGLPLDSGINVEDVCSLLQVKDQCVTLAEINPSAWQHAKQSPEYLNILDGMSYVLADGIGVVLAFKLFAHAQCKRISFDMTSLADPFFRKSVELKAPIALIGSKSGVCEAVKEKLQSRYAGIDITHTIDGYGPFESKISAVMANPPAAVIVGMGAPKQEFFVKALRDAGYKGCLLTCGGFFDQYLSADKYYPKTIDFLNLRFLYRLYKEPRRLWRRYLVDYQPFVRECFKEAGKKMLSRSIGYMGDPLPGRTAPESSAAPQKPRRTISGIREDILFKLCNDF